MDLDVLHTSEEAEACNFSRRLTVVIDVLRATTTIIAALEAGAAAIRPVGTVGEARSIHSKAPETILCGERGGVAVPGFDFGNSPLEIAAAAIERRVLVLTTTNGTRTTVAASQSVRLYAGCLRNLGAVARVLTKSLADLSMGGRPSEIDGITIACSGTDGRYSIDDVYAAGLLVSHLESVVDSMSDSAHAAKLLAAVPVLRAVNSLTCRHIRVLEGKGFQRDIEYALEIDASDTVGVFQDGVFASATT